MDLIELLNAKFLDLAKEVGLGPVSQALAAFETVMPKDSSAPCPRSAQRKKCCSYSACPNGAVDVLTFELGDDALPVGKGVMWG